MDPVDLARFAHVPNVAVSGGGAASGAVYNLADLQPSVPVVSKPGVFPEDEEQDNDVTSAEVFSVYAPTWARRLPVESRCAATRTRPHVTAGGAYTRVRVRTRRPGARRMARSLGVPARARAWHGAARAGHGGRHLERARLRRRRAARRRRT